MSIKKKKEILKWNIWIHIFLSILTYFIWDIFLLKWYFDIKNAKISKIEKSIDSPVLVKKVVFKVAGITFENRQDIIKKIVKNGISDGYIEPYGNMSNKEIKEIGEVSEVENTKITTLRLEPIELDGKDAIEVYVKDFSRENEYMIGYVPKDHLEETISLIGIMQEHPEYKLEADSYFTGGKFKTVEYDYEKGKEIIVTDEKNYGLNVSLKLYKMPTEK